MRWVVLIAASAALHALVFVVAGAVAPLPAPVGQKPPLLLVPVELTPPASRPAAPRAEPTAAARPRTRPKKGPTSEAAGELGTGPSSPVNAPGPEVAVSPDAPRSAPAILTPRVGAIFGGDVRTEPSHGSTVRNGPGEEMDTAVAREVEGEQLTRKLNADLLGDVGSAAVGAGTVPGHFRRAESRMREAFHQLQVDRTPLTGKQIVEDVAKTLFLTGTPSETAARKVADSPLGNSVRNQAVTVPNTDDNRFREQGLQLMAGVEALKERAGAARLKTVLQLTTDPSGAVADVTVLERSGDSRFDESVLHLSRRVFRHLPDDDEKALGADWWSSKWQFTYEPPDVRVRLLDAHRLPHGP